MERNIFHSNDRPNLLAADSKLLLAGCSTQVPSVSHINSGTVPAAQGTVPGWDPSRYIDRHDRLFRAGYCTRCGKSGDKSGEDHTPNINGVGVWFLTSCDSQSMPGGRHATEF